MTQPWPDNAADLAALVQQLLVFHGGRYTSRASEDSWKTVPVTLEVPKGRPIAGGTWVVLPWDIPSTDQLQIWLGRLAAVGTLPDVAVLAVQEPILDPRTVRIMGIEAGLQLIVCCARPPGVMGTRSAVDLEALLDPAIRGEISSVNPLTHLHELGDPREPAVFVERLRRAAPGQPVTKALITINVLVFAAMVLAALQQEPPAQVSLVGTVLGGFSLSQLTQWGANAPGAADGHLWRLLASVFLHGNLLHIGMNMLVLRQLGDTAERLFGSANYLAVYLLSGLGGAIASFGWHALYAPGAISVGASGAVFGIMGGTLGFALARRDMVPRSVYSTLVRSGLFFAVLNIGFGLAVDVVDNAAHLGGLAVGLATGAVLSRELPPAPQMPWLQRLGIVGASLAVLGLLFRVASGWVVP